MTPVDHSSDGLIILGTMTAIVLTSCAVAYAVSEISKWIKTPYKSKPLPKPMEKDLDLYQLRLRPKAKRLCLYHIQELKAGVAALDPQNCQYCNRGGA